MSLLTSKDGLSGLLLCAFAAWFGSLAWPLKFLDGSRLGPGFLPVSLSVLLGLIGLVILAKASLSQREATDFGPIGTMAAIVVALVAFSYIYRPLGLLISGAMLVTVCTLISGKAGLLKSLVVGVVVSVLASVVFVRLIGLPLPLYPNVSVF